MKPLQEKQFNLLKTTVEVCDQLGLEYYLVCGSVLGAVKYGGFIPWDDDIDIGMKRPDYDKFCKEAPSLLPEYYSLQNIDTDNNFTHIYSKLRDSRTTFIEKPVSHINMNHGVYIDIFPIDGYPTDSRDIKKLERSLKLLRLGLGAVYRFNNKMKLTTKIFFILERMLRLHYCSKFFIDKINELISAYPVETSSIWCNHGNWQGRLGYAPCSQYGDGTWAEFEGLKVRIPEKYDEYLTQKYGNWRADLPVEQQVGHHYYEILDLDHPYTYYISSISKDGKRIKLRNE